MSSFQDLFCWASSKLDKAQLRTFLCLAWAGWCCRNKAIFGDTNEINGVMIAASFVRMCEDYCVYNARVGGCVLAPISFSRASWIPPQSHFVKVNIDAYVPSNGGVCLGVVIRDEWGKILLLATKKTSCRWSSDMAEAAAACYGTQLARRFSFTNVILEGDSMIVVRAVRDKQEGAAPIFHFYESIYRMSAEFVEFNCVHVRRAGNTIAHLVAKRDTGASIECICTDSIPQSVQTLADLDFIN
ncbi:uncharacterized protein LOC110716687 [Chenopodium quinoa]|uniref:uncharacterized protein LOC110716687 n=1 Tax=Chenopodium quinoa TaxID=63459 RepID=UPI000B78747E|nr:uncharacterized protein LOC110716687 [Chenopodium quinoa]